MKQLNLGMKMLLGIIASVVLGLMVLGGGVWSASPTMMYAAEATPPADHSRLEYALKREQILLDAQQDRLDRSREMAALLQSWLDDQKAKGKDTAALETALAKFNTQLATAQATHDKAKTIFEAKAGFDANGKVTDVAQARETLKTVRQSMHEAHQILKQATHDVHQAFREYRQANKNK